MMQSLRGIATSFPSYARPCRNFSLSFTLSSPKRSPGAVLIGVTATQQRPLAGPSLLYLYIPPDHTIGFETASRGIIERPFSLSLSLSSLTLLKASHHTHTQTTQSTSNDASKSGSLPLLLRRPTVLFFSIVPSSGRASLSLSPRANRNSLSFRRQFFKPPIETHSRRTRLNKHTSRSPHHFLKPFRFEFFFVRVRGRAYAFT